MAEKRIKTGGRKAGTPNKLTANAREAFQAVFDDIGGKETLAAWAQANPSDFYRLYARLIPQDLNHGGQKENPLTSNLAALLDERLAQRERMIAMALESKEQTLITDDRLGS